jgi:hypothetical protein
MKKFSLIFLICAIFIIFGQFGCATFYEYDKDGNRIIHYVDHQKRCNNCGLPSYNRIDGRE